MAESSMNKNQKFEVSYQITDSIYTGFMLLFDDNNELHINSDYAKSKGFKEKVMHGNILCGFLSNFVGQLLPPRNTIIHSITINFMKPCYLNEMIKLNILVVEYHESVSVCILDFKFSSNNEIVAKGTLQIGLI